MAPSHTQQNFTYGMKSDKSDDIAKVMNNTYIDEEIHKRVDKEKQEEQKRR